MRNEEMDRNKTTKDNEDASLKPDSETLHRTDPQENMKGPVSSLMHNTGQGFDTDKTKEEAENEKDRKL